MERPIEVGDFMVDIRSGLLILQGLFKVINIDDGNITVKSLEFENSYILTNQKGKWITNEPGINITPSWISKENSTKSSSIDTD